MAKESRRRVQDNWLTLVPACGAGDEPLGLPEASVVPWSWEWSKWYWGGRCGGRIGWYPGFKNGGVKSNEASSS